MTHYHHNIVEWFLVSIASVIVVGSFSTIAFLLWFVVKL